MIDFWDLAIFGYVNHLSENSTMDDVMGLLGTPDHVEPSRKSYLTMMLYGYSEFRFRDKLLTYFGCDFLCDFDQAHGYKVFAQMPSEDLRT